MPRKQKRHENNESADFGITQIDTGGWLPSSGASQLPAIPPNEQILSGDASDHGPSQLHGNGPPEWMTHFMQREDYDCGLTSVAMAGGLTYEEAQVFDPRPKPVPDNRGLWAREMIELLDKSTARNWRIGLPGKKNYRIQDYKPPAGVDRGVMLTKVNPEQRGGHWVAFAVTAAGEVWIFDPASRAPYLASDGIGYVRKLVLPKVSKPSRKSGKM